MDKTRKLILFKILPFFLAILMVGLLIFEAILPAQAAAVILEFTYNGQTCQVQAGTSGSNAEAGVIWTVTGTNNVKLTFEKSGTFALTAGSTFNLSGATAIGGGGGGGAAGGMWANSSFVSNNWNAQSVGLGGAGGQITTANAANITALNGQSLVIQIGEGGSGGKAKNSDCYTGYITRGSSVGTYDTEAKNVSMTTSATNGYYAVEYVGYQCCDDDVTNTNFTRDKGTNGGTTTVKVGASTILTATGGAAEGGASPSAPLAWGNGVNGTAATATKAASGGSGACTYQNSQRASYDWGDDGFETGAGNANGSSWSCWLCGGNDYGGLNWNQVTNTTTIPRDSTARAYVSGSRMVGGTGGSGGTYSTGAAGNGGSPGNDHNCGGFTIYSNRGTDATGYGNGGGGGALSTVRYGIWRFGHNADSGSTILGRLAGSGGNGASGAVMLTGTASREVSTGSLTITKDSNQGSTGITRSFTVTGPNSYSNTFTMPSSGTYTINDLPLGTYTVKETSASNYNVYAGTDTSGTLLSAGASTASQTAVISTNGQTVTVNFYNVRRTGALTIQKTSDINDTNKSGINGKQFKITGTSTDASYTSGYTISMDASGTKTLTGLKTGTYKIEELDSSGFIVHSGTSAVGTVLADATQTVTLTSSGATVQFYNEVKKGNLTITKGAAATQNITRQFTVTGPYDYSNTFTMPSSGTYTLSNLPIGTYTVTELDSSGYVVHSGTSVTGAVLADAAQTVTLSTSGSTVAFYNEPARGNIHITKSASDGLVEGVGFTVTGPDGYTNTFNMPDSGVYDITDVPLGAYTITENGASSYTVYAGTDNTGTSISDGAANASQTVNLTADGQTVNVNFYNDRIKGSIIIKKYASNGTEGITKQFKITGISEGTSYPAGYIVDMPCTGTLEVGNLYVGTYTVEELNADGYVVHKGNTVGGEVLVNASQTVVAARTGATVQFFNEKSGGEITIKKTASDGRIAGIVFTVTGPSYPTGQDFTTNASGVIVSERVLPGEYTIKEKDPTGYAVYKGTNEFGDELANAAVTVTVNADVTVEFYNKMLTGSLTIQKNSEDGTSYREGKRFTVTVISDGPYQGQSWPAVTNASGIATFNNLPIGTYRVDEDEYDNYIAYSDTVTISNGNASTLPVRNVTRKGGISIYKVDSVMGNTPQGDASLGNAVFEIVNMSGKTIVYNGLQIEDGEIACTLTTDSSGYATTGAEMISTGTYLVREVTAPTGYILNSAWSRTVTFTENGDMLTLTASDACPDDVILGGISITKTSDVDVLLPNTEFSITNASAKAVVVNGTVFNPGAEIMRVTTDEYGIARTGNVLPYGSYSVRETRAPQGYNINADWNPTVQIRELNVSQQLTCSDDTDLHNIIIKKNLNLVSEYGIPTVTYGQPIFMFKVYGYDVNNIYHEWYSYLYGLAESDSRECGFYNIPSGIYTIEEIPVSGYKLTGIIAGENTTVNGLAGATATLLAENANATVCFENHIDQVDKIFSNDVVKNHIEEAHVSTLTMMRLSMRDSADISAVLLDNMVMYLSSEPYELTEGDEYNSATVIAVYNDISTSVEDIPWADCADEIDVVNVEDDGVPVSFVYKWFTEAQIMGEVDKTFTVVYVDEFDAATHTDTVNVTEPGFIDITEAANGNTGIAEGKLYGGMFTDNDGEKNFSKYGLRFVPKNGETYYVREIPESYLRADAISVYPSGKPYAEAVYAVLPVSDIDFSRIGFEVNTDGVVSDISGDRIYNDVSIEYADFTKCIYKPVDLFGASLSNAFIYAAELEVNKTENGLVAPEQTITITPYWITRDGVKVSSAVSCTVNTNDGVGVNYNGLTAIAATETMAEAYSVRENSFHNAALQVDESICIYQTVEIHAEPDSTDAPDEDEPPEESDSPAEPEETLETGPSDDPNTETEDAATNHGEQNEAEATDNIPSIADEDVPENKVVVDFEAGNISYTINSESMVKQAVNKNVLVSGSDFNSMVSIFMDEKPVKEIVFGMYDDYTDSVSEWAASTMYLDENDEGHIRGFYSSEKQTLYVLADGVMMSSDDSRGMFEEMQSIEKITFEFLVLSEEANIDRMFKGCTKLKTIECDEDWSEQARSGAEIFDGCENLKGGENTTYSSQTDLRHARVDKIGTAGMFTATRISVKYERYYNPVNAAEISASAPNGDTDGDSREISDILSPEPLKREENPEEELTGGEDSEAVIISG